MTKISIRPTVSAARSDVGAARHCLSVVMAFEDSDRCRALRALDDAEAVLERAREHIREARKALCAFYPVRVA